MKNKTGLYLVSTVPIKRQYDMFYIFLIDGSIYEYKLQEIRIMRDEEWVEITRLDKTMIESFSNANILRVKFMSSKAKLVESEKKGPHMTPVA